MKVVEQEDRDRIISQYKSKLTQLARNHMVAVRDYGKDSRQANVTKQLYQNLAVEFADRSTTDKTKVSQRLQQMMDLLNRQADEVAKAVIENPRPTESVVDDEGVNPVALQNASDTVQKEVPQDIKNEFDEWVIELGQQVEDVSIIAQPYMAFNDAYVAYIRVDGEKQKCYWQASRGWYTVGTGESVKSVVLDEIHHIRESYVQQ